MVINPGSFHGNGQYLTSHGVLKILIVMVQFPDDNHDPDNLEWPINPNGAPQPAPFWVQHPEILVTPINQHAPGIPFWYAPGSLSEFYYQMSSSLPEGDRLRVYGDVVHHVFPFTREQMRTYTIGNNPPGMKVHEGLNILFNGLVGMPGLQLPPGRTYAIYDNWTTNADYQHAYMQNPDPNQRYVDLVIVCWRNIMQNLDPGLVRDYLVAQDWLQPTRAQLGWAATPDIIAAGGYRIRTGRGMAGASTGSGIWFRDFLELTPAYRSSGARDGSFRGLVHEIGHLHLGGHFAGGPWSMISNSDHRSYAPTAFEMAELGWITPLFYRKNQVLDENVLLGDLYTTGNAVAIEVDAASNRWYFLENHQMISKYDFASSFDDIRGSTKGLYVLYHQDHNQSLQSATGAFDWSVPSAVYKPEWGNKNVPVFAQGLPNPSTGFTRSEMVRVDIQQPNGGITWWHPIILVEASNTVGYTEENHFSGRYAGDGHRVCESGMWGTLTNPANHYVNRQVTPNQTFGTETSFRIVSETNGTMEVNIANNNVDIIPPARVTSITVPSSVVPDLVIAWPTPCTTIRLIQWNATIPDADFDHFLITGGDVPVTAPATAASANIAITTAANEARAKRLINVYTVDVVGNVSCNSLDGTKVSIALSCDNTQQSKSSLTPAVSIGQQVMVIPSVYPQPTRDVVTIRIPGDKFSGFVITDVAGQCHPQPGSVTLSDGAVELQIIVQSLPPGVYCVAVATERGKSIVPIYVH